MIKKRIIGITLFLFCFTALLIIHILGLKGMVLSVIATFLLLIISVEAGLMMVKGKSKEMFRIFGGIAAWFAVCLIWYWILWQMGCSELISRLSFFLNSFWALNLLLLIILSFLGKTKVIDFFVKTIVLGSFLVIAFTCLSFFSENLARQRQQIISQLMKGVSASAVQNIREKHLISETDSFLKSLEQLQETAKTRPLSEEELKKLDGLEAELARIYSKSEKEARGKEGRILSGIFDVPAEKVVYTRIIAEKGESVEYEQLQEIGRFLFLGSKENLEVTERRGKRPVLARGEIRIKGGQKPVKVSVRIISN